MKLKILLIISIMGITAIVAGCENNNSSDSKNSQASSTTTSIITREERSESSSVSTSQADNTAKSTDSQNTDKTISEDEAKQIALEDAKVSESEVKNIRVKLKRDDGALEYEVDFYVDNNEYEYEISASDGAILSMDTDIKNDFGSAASRDASVTVEDAKKIALAKVPGATENDIHIHAEKDDGRLIYEGSILYNEMEYEFEIDGETGKIWSWESESIYD